MYSYHQEVKLTITALVTDEGFEDKIESILDDDELFTEFKNGLLQKNTHKLTYALDNNFAEIIDTKIEIKRHEVEVSK